MPFGRQLEEDIRPGIDEETDARRIGDLPNAPEAIALVDSLAKFSICRKAVFQIAADGPRVDRTAARLADGVRRVAIAAFQVYRDRQVGRVDDPAQVVDRQSKRS